MENSFIAHLLISLKLLTTLLEIFLWYKLIKLGVRGQILKVIKSMYQNIKSKVKCNNELSDEFSCSLGVRQGECLSSFYLLFL